MHARACASFSSAHSTLYAVSENKKQDLNLIHNGSVNSVESVMLKLLFG